MIRHILLALGLSLSFMSAWNSASMSRSYNNDASAAPAQSYQPSFDDDGHPSGRDRSGYIVASS